MRNIKVELISNTPLYNSIIGARTCWKSFERDDYNNEYDIGKNNTQLLNRLVYEYKHESVIEHTVYTFRLSGFSRFILQELVRHRIGSYSVESTRYVIRKDVQRYSNYFENYEQLTFKDKFEIVERFLVVPYVKSYVSTDILHQFENLFYIYLKTKAGIANDEIKYILPENWRVNNAIVTFNARSLRNLFNLRLSHSAHFEIRYLTFLMLKTIPDTHRNILFNDIVDNFANEIGIEKNVVFNMDNIEVLRRIIGAERFEDKSKTFAAG